MPELNRITEINYLNAVSFETNFRRIPKTSFTCTSVTVPSLALGVTNYASLFSDLPIEGDKILYEQLSINFIISEDFSNYLEIYNWITSIGFPDNFQQFSLKESLAAASGTDTLKSDMSIIVNTNKSNPNYEILFKDAFPTSLSTLDFDVTTRDYNYFTAEVTFKYTIFNITDPKGVRIDNNFQK